MYNAARTSTLCCCHKNTHLDLQQLLCKVVEGGGLVALLHVLLLGQVQPRRHGRVVQHSLERASECETARYANGANGVQPVSSALAVQYGSCHRTCSATYAVPWFRKQLQQFEVACGSSTVSPTVQQSAACYAPVCILHYCCLLA